MSAELLSLFPPNVAESYAMNGGDDYELCFTAAPAQAQTVVAVLEATGCRACKIGQLIDGDAVQCCRDGEPFEPGATGYRHF
jgi:thiamine-monophosphate kinase